MTPGAGFDAGWCARRNERKGNEMATKKMAQRALGLPGRIYIGFDHTGSEIVATYGSRREVDQFRQPDEIVTGPWMRVPRARTRGRKS